MGIDAEIVLKIKGDKPTDEWLQRTSFAICAALGADKFFVKDGLPPEQYKPAYDAWVKAFDAHPDHAEYMRERKTGGVYEKSQEAYARIIADLGKPPEEMRRAVNLTPFYGEDRGKDEDPTPGKTYWQDADEPMRAGKNEWLLRVSVWTRFYGIGYERGDILFICAVAEWAEANIPGVVVYYGGDSSGVLAEPFDDKARRKLRKHFYGAHGRDYFAAFGSYMPRKKMPLPQPCSLCLPEGFRGNEYMWGGTDTLGVHCQGCGKNFVTRDAGKTWAVEKSKD